MALKLYELDGAEDRRFSPYCWRSLLALRHKGQEAERIPIKFSEKDKIAFSGQERVPILCDGETTISDSWLIAEYLEDTYVQGASLFGGPLGRAEARFINAWVDTQMHPRLVRLVVRDVYDSVPAEDKAYYKETREARFGTSFDTLHASRDEHLAAFREAISPVRATTEAQPFLCGDTPAYADYIVFGAFQWGRCVSPYQLLEPDDPVYAWRERILDLFGGFARQAPGYPV